MRNGFDILGLDFSPIKGPKGNIEYLIYLQKSENFENLTDFDIKSLVDISHEALNK